MFCGGVEMPLTAGGPPLPPPPDADTGAESGPADEAILIFPLADKPQISKMGM